MNYRKTKILASKSVTVNATETIDINIRDIISSIYVRIQAKNGSTPCTPAGHPAGFATKVELVDGSDVLFGLDGYEIQALNYYDRLVTPDTELIDGENDYHHASFLLDFGRFLYDPMLAFDPKKFVNPQLKITNDWDLVDSSAAAGYLLVEADVFDEKMPSPIGFLMSKEIEAYTMGNAAAHKYIDLPLDHPFRKLLFRAYITNKAPNSIIDDFKLSEDHDKRIPIDVDIDEYLRWQMGILPPLVEHFQLRLSATAKSVYTMPTYWPMAFVMPSASGYVNYDGTYYEGERHSLIANATISGASQGHIFGYVPHHTICFNFGDQNDMDDWYDVTRLGSLRADIYQKTQAAACILFGQQMRRY